MFLINIYQMEEVNRLWVTEAFIRLLVQLQDRAIWAIPDKKVVTSGAYTVLQHFEIMPQRKPDIGEDALYFQIHHTEISVQYFGKFLPKN